MDQLLLLARDMSRAERRYLLNGSSPSQVNKPSGLNRRLRGLLTAYEVLLDSGEQTLRSVEKNVPKKRLKQALAERLNAETGRNGKVTPFQFDINFLPLAVQILFRDGHTAASYFGTDTFGKAMAMPNPEGPEHLPIAVIAMGKRMGVQLHEVAHVLNIYRSALFGYGLTSGVDGLSAHVLSPPMARLWLFDQERLATIAESNDKDALARHFRCGIGRTLGDEVAPLAEMIITKGMISGVLDLDARAINTIMEDQRRSQKALFKRLLDQHPFSHLECVWEVPLIASCAITITRAEVPYTFNEILECARA